MHLPKLLFGNDPLFDMLLIYQALEIHNLQHFWGEVPH